MADRTSAALFAEIFEFLAENPEDTKNREFAQKLFEMTSSYDFSRCQMGCDGELVKLGIKINWGDDE